MKTGLCWIRRDIRLHDHAALSQCLKDNDRVYVVFVFDDAILAPIKAKASTDRRVQFICEALIELHQGLHAFGGGVVIRYGDPVHEIPELVSQLSVDSLYFNRDYSPYALRRDGMVTDKLNEMGRKVYSFQDHLVVEPHDILTQQGTPFRVFTPYSRVWRSRLPLDGGLSTFDVQLKALPEIPRFEPLDNAEALLAFAGFSLDRLDLRGGAKAGLSQLATFLDSIDQYAHDRDYPSVDGTSQLSVYLRHGCVSIRDMVNPALAMGSGAEKWVSELIWREFYQMVFFHSPWVDKLPFQERFRSLQFPTSEEYLVAFKEGMTGFPLVDAAMRCLNETGWMHNRLRMVVASFLTKILLVDWKRGERYFSWKLLDYELQSNNGGWQWAAGIGCDAAPYFRIFNPTTQSKTYDPDGVFIRQYCPELRTLSSTQIHCPAEAKSLPVSFQLGRDYPLPIVNYKTQRQRALALFSGHEAG